MRKLHVIDLTPEDIGIAIDELQKLHNEGQLQGLMFVCKVRGRKRPLVGTAGCCVTDPMATLGAAGYLYRAVTDKIFSK